MPKRSKRRGVRQPSSASLGRPKALNTKTRAGSGTANSRAATTGPRPTSRTARNTFQSVIDRQSPPRKISTADFFAGHAGAFNSLEHDPENACPGLDPGRMPVLQKRSCSTKKSERKPVAAVRADYQLTITFHEMAAPRPVLGILCLLNGRCRDRRVSY